MKNKLWKVTCFVLSAAIFLSACSNQTKVNETTHQEAPIYEWGDITGRTITVWGDRDDLSRPYMVRAFEDYQEKTGNIIKTVSLTKSELNEKVPYAFSTAGEERPDMLLAYGGTNVENLDPDENFYDFTDAPWIDDLSDTALTQAVFNGKVIGLPHGEASISGTLYNKEIFEKYNLEIPKTQDEFMNVCETLLKNGVTPVYLPYAEITMLLYQFPMDSFLKDQSILDGLNDGTLSYADIPEMKKIVQWYKTMSDKGYFGDDYENNDWNGMDKAMKDGEYAMMLCWDTWLYTDYTGEPSKIGIMPAFMGEPENGCFEGANIILCLANKNSNQLDATLDLINFMADPCNYNNHYAGVYTAPVFNNQSGSITTPQYMEAEIMINRLFCQSTAWSRVRGFSQIDASYIQQFMQNELSLDACLTAMNDARLKRIDSGE
ncbi:ABC transporter substrate-binding protein [uncultured Robinsoniella sp.]|uniref:ABC transporter substrate-binding protein n=1 Tax=uncultured Robinsoniella sp. TaxID=904190 RepID=UPI00374E5FCC